MGGRLSIHAGDFARGRALACTRGQALGAQEGETVGREGPRPRGLRSVAGRQWDASQEEKSGWIILWMSFALIVGETCNMLSTIYMRIGYDTLIFDAKTYLFQCHSISEL